jgi:hypothetical protein
MILDYYPKMGYGSIPEKVLSAYRRSVTLEAPRSSTYQSFSLGAATQNEVRFVVYIGFDGFLRPR